VTNSNKLKPVKWGLIFSLILIGSVICISIFAILDATLGKQAKLNAYGYTWLAFAVFNFVLWIIRKDLVSLTFLLINLTLAVSYLSDYKGLFIIFPLLLFYSFYAYLVYINYRLNSHYRQLLELAAEPIKNTADGFTQRPFPAGKIDLDKEKLFEFAGFLNRNLIAYPYIDHKGISFAVKDHRRFWFGRPSEKKDTYIYFNLNGNVVVNIARKDYQKYKDEYTFDELCHSLGNLFKQFFEYYRNGKNQQILKMMAN
jgi:hypothetical protein